MKVKENDTGSRFTKTNYFHIKRTEGAPIYYTEQMRYLFLC